jgi:Mrp family chromosome partitioning ATPase
VLAFKLAGAIHELGKSVLFIDGDMKEEIFLSKYRLGKDLKGVTSYLSGSEDARDLVCITNRNDFDVVFTGNVDGISIKDLDPARLRDFIDNYVDYDMVVVKSDELGKVASCCDRSVLMLQQAEYSEMAAQQKVKNLDKQGCYVLGVVINE